MSVHFEPSRAVASCAGARTAGSGRGGSHEAEAIAFDAALARARPASGAVDAADARGGDGVYAYATKAGTRYRFVFRQSDGSLSTRRGFTSRAAAATARRQLVESIERGEVEVCRETSRRSGTRLLEASGRT